MLPVSVMSFLTFVNVEMTPETAFAAGVPAAKRLPLPQ